MSKIGIIGLGYVGLPISLQFSRCGAEVIGFDIDPEKIKKLGKGESYLKHISSDAIAEQLESGRLDFTDDFKRIAELSSVVICVPTPLGKHREPDISYIIRTAEAIAPHLQKGTLVALESTTYPGTTDEDLRETLERLSGLTAGRDFHLAYSPEREDPGNKDFTVASVPKIVGGYTPECLRRAVDLYRRAIENVIPVSSCRTAEAAKLLENIFRSVNIALVNELKVIYQAMDIDIWDVIDAAKSKPFGFMAFYPGPGLGGHCIPIDPFYLTWKAREFGNNPKFIELAGEINTSMPGYVLARTVDALNEMNKCLKGSRILLLGLAYKPNVDDIRESPAFELMDLFSERGAEVDFYDPHVPVIGPTREHGGWAGKKSVSWDEAAVTSYDACVIVTAHDEVDYTALGSWAQCIIDTRNAMAGIDVPPGKLNKA